MTTSNTGSTKFKWKIDNLRDRFLCPEDKFSDEIALDCDQTTRFALYFNSCVPLMHDDSQPLGVVLRDFKDKDSVKVTVKLWLESNKGNRLVEHLFSDHVFIEVDEKCGFSLELSEFNFFSKCFEQNGTVYLCASFRYDIPDKNANILAQLEKCPETDLLIQAEKCTFKARKSAMMDASPIFKKLLASGDSIIKLEDVPDDVAEAMIAWIHFKKISNLTNLAESLFMVAEKYKLVELKFRCLDAMSCNLTKENLFARLVLAFVYEDAPRLKRRALEFAVKTPHSEYLTPLLISTEWLDLVAKNAEFAEKIMNAIFEQIHET